MSCILKKLHSDHGASLLFAFMFLLVSLTLGSVILAAASANAGRTANIRQQQNYLSVSSAARLLAEDITGAEFSASYEQTDVYTYHPPVENEDGSITPGWTEYDGPSFRSSSGDALLSGGSLLNRDDLYRLFCYPLEQQEILPSSHDAASSVSRELCFQDEAAMLPIVSGSVTIDETYAITVELWIESGSKALDRMTLAFQADAREASETAVEESGDRTTHTTTYTTTVTWNPPTIMKGGASS